MSSRLGNSGRTVIPRWRPSDTFSESPVSAPLRARASSVTFRSWFDQANAEWESLGTAGALSEAFSAAITENRREEARGLAVKILDYGDAVPFALQNLASRSLELGEPDLDLAVSPRWTEVEVVGRSVSFLRKKSVSQPRNAFIWHDLSYNFLMLGDEVKAERAMSIALGVSKHHRLIVRSACRFFSHIRANDRALSTVKNGRGFAQDPWLLSAHLAISQSERVPSKFLKQASLVHEGRKGQIQSSELGMALATEAMLNGKSKVAKRLAREASVAPTENSLAQGVWISRQLNVDSIVSDIQSAKDAHEAQAWDAYYRGDWEASLRHSLGWLNDQPFSSKPALLASFIAETFLRDYNLAERVTRFSLRINSRDWMLTNNLVVSLAQQDKLREAELEFSGLDVPPIESEDYATWLATSGLLAFRRGDVDAGRALYVASAEICGGMRDRTNELVGAIYRSLEESRIGESGIASRLLKSVRESLREKSQKSRDEHHVLEVLDQEIRALELKREHKD